MAARPLGVTLVAVIAWLNGVVGLFQGVGALFSEGIIVGVIAIVLAVIVILVSFGLFGGSPGSRVLVTIAFVLNLVSAIVLLVQQPENAWANIAGVALPLAGLVLLYTPRANAFFARRR